MKIDTKFEDYIETLIRDYGRESYHQLEENEKQELAAYYIKQNFRERSEFLYCANNYDAIVGFLLQYIIGCDPDHKEIMVDEMKKAAAKYFEREISEIFNWTYSEYDYAIKIESGLKPYQHKDNGETWWR